MNKTRIKSYQNASDYNLTTYTIEDGIYEIGEGAFENCYMLNTINFNEDVQLIEEGVFKNCRKLQTVKFPSSVLSIAPRVLENCLNLQTVELPECLHVISDELCSNCSNLKYVEIPQDVYSINTKAFLNCMSLKDVTMSTKNVSILPKAFYNCNHLETIKNSEYIRYISEEAFSNCLSLKKIDLSNVLTLLDKAFYNCINLEQIVIPINSNITYGKQVFMGCKFDYFYRDTKQNKYVFSKTLPQENIDNVVNILEAEKYVYDFDMSILLNNDIAKIFPELLKKLKSSNMIISHEFLQSFTYDKQYAELENMDFRFFANEVEDLKTYVRGNLDPYETLGYFKFAKAIGCFSDIKIKDKLGKETNVYLGQKASSLFARLNKTNFVEKINFDDMFSNLGVDIKSNQQFLDFISIKDENKQYKNLNMLFDLSKGHEDIFFTKVINNFNQIKKLRRAIDSYGSIYTRPWDEAILTYLTENYYDGVTDENKDIAQLFVKMGVSQEIFDATLDLKNEAKQKNIIHHILGEELKEKTILEEIEDIKNQTNLDLKQAKTMLDEVYNKQFTYEMLDKHDPKNAIIGIYCNCCATVINTFYGRDIVKYSMVSNDIQNMVIRDKDGDIIAKCAIYINRKFGYAVINDFEINEKFKKNETDEPGYYKDSINSKNEKDREKIFETFMRGIKAFVKKYDEQNPNRPIEKVNVGTGFNRLKLQCNRFKDETENLDVPYEYAFEDTYSKQKILYERSKNSTKVLSDLRYKHQSYNNYDDDEMFKY